MHSAPLWRRSAVVTNLVVTLAASLASAAPVKTPLKTTTAGPASSSRMIDIALDSDRTLRGRFVDVAGKPIDGAVVSLRQSEKVVASTTTRADGTFLIERVPVGAYRLTCGSASGPVRCWTSEAAPPHAMADGITFQDNVVRGQAMVAPAILGSSVMTAAATSGAVIGGVSTYAALNDSDKTVPSSAPSTSPPPPLLSQSGSAVVGRDIHGNLVRLDGPPPWQGLPSGRDNEVTDPDNIILPDNWPVRADEFWSPSSP
jgi:hypothetical protein